MHRLPPPAASRRTLVGLAATAAVTAFTSGRATALPGLPTRSPVEPTPLLAARLAPGDVVGVIDHVKPLGVPGWRGASIGHIDRQFTLPIGADVEIDAAAHTIRMLAPAVR